MKALSIKISHGNNSFIRKHHTTHNNNNERHKSTCEIYTKNIIGLYDHNNQLHTSIHNKADLKHHTVLLYTPTLCKLVIIIFNLCTLCFF